MRDVQMCKDKFTLTSVLSQRERDKVRENASI